jgi:hypothetical protein
MRNFSLRDMACTALGDARLATLWLERPSPLFAHRNPVQAMATQEGRLQVERQLNWFAGGRHNRPESGDPPRPAPERGDSLRDLLGDPMMELVLARAGTGPEELLGLCREIAERKRAALPVRAA